MSSQNTTFIFQGYDAALEKGYVAFHYLIRERNKKRLFTEKITFPAVSFIDVPQEVVTAVLDNVLLMLGISYWKLYCPQQIEIVPFDLTKEQAEFWNTVYTKGLGEYFYKNKIDYRGLIKFPFEEEKKQSTKSEDNSNTLDKSFRLNEIGRFRTSQNDNIKKRSLVLIGGGKDSLVTSELIKKTGKPFTAFVINPKVIHKETIQVMGQESIFFTRKLDPQLFVLNKETGKHNGHIPVTAINSFLALFASVIYNYEYIIASNEKSASYGNIAYLGEEINHQWSKSEAFEKLFQKYIAEYITPHVYYFSLLRPLSELKITEIFSKYEKYFSVFSSCNRNFRIESKEEILKQAMSADMQAQDDNKENIHTNTRWCRECPKCVFVFTMLAAFLSRERVAEIFGKNLFEDEKLAPLVKELLGLGEVKPFECVGTPDEMSLALHLIQKKGEFENTPLMRMFAREETLSEEDMENMKEELFKVDVTGLPKEFQGYLQI